MTFQSTTPGELVIRFAGADDAVAAAAVSRLARLDSQPVAPGAPLLIAERDGSPVAARSLSDGTTVANPFLPTADAVAMLALRAHQVHGGAPVRRSRLSLLRGRLALS